MQIPSSSEIQKKLSGPLGALPNPKDLANKAKVNTPNADNLVSKVQPHPPPLPLPYDPRALLTVLCSQFWTACVQQAVLIFEIASMAFDLRNGVKCCAVQRLPSSAHCVPVLAMALCLSSAGY